VRSAISDIQTLDRTKLVKELELLPNFPNPFNHSTAIKFRLNQKSRIYLIIYDIRGNLVKYLIQNESYRPGIYRKIWDGTDLNGNPVSSGVYIYKLKTQTISQSRKMILIK